MVESNRDPMIAKLHDLGKRIQARIEEIRDKGVFSDVRAAFLHEAEERCAQMDHKLEQAIAKGALLEATALELERDYDGLQLELARWIERHDENAMKSS